MADPENPEVPIPPPPPVAPPSAGSPKQQPPKPAQPPQPAAQAEPTTPPEWKYQSEVPPKPASMNAIVAVLVIFTFICMVFVLGSSKGLLKGSSFGSGNSAGIAAQMVDLHDPLPPDWQYGSSTAIMGVKIADVDYKPNGQLKATVEFITIPNRNNASAQTMANDAAYGNNGLVTEGKPFNKLANFDGSLAGHKVHWARGSRDVKGNSAVDVGFVELANNKVLILQVTEYGIPTFDQSIADAMFNSISKFKE